MADESEDQWLYGDSTDSKEYTPANIQSEIQQNDSTLAEAQNKQTQEDQKMEGAGETPSEVRDLTSRSFTINIFPTQHYEKKISYIYFDFEGLAYLIFYIIYNFL